MSVGSLLGSPALRVLLLFGGISVAASCGGGSDVTGPPDPPAPPAVESVELAPAAVNLAVAQTSQLTATVRAADGSALTGRSVTWATGDAGIASIGKSGLVTAVAAGEVQVTATSEGKTGRTAVTVSNEPVATVEVRPSPASVALGQTGQLVAVPKSAGGTELLGRTVAWTTADPAIATVSGSGVVTGVAVGEVTITATSEGKSGASRLTVSAISVATVAVDPPTTSIAEGATVELTATAKDADGATLAGRAPTWSTSDAGVASVNANGKVTGLSAGTATISATVESKTGTAAITVIRRPVASVTLSPSAPTVTTGKTAQLTATVKDAQGVVLQGRVVTWTTSAEGVAKVSGSGLVTGVAPGTATITATSEGVSGTTTVTVTAASGIVRTWKGGASGKASDWSAPANWNPLGAPIPLDTVRVPATTAAPVLKADVQIARLILAGGRLRTAGFRLSILGR
jgi:trimeric autotransporter adhesin